MVRIERRFAAHILGCAVIFLLVLVLWMLLQLYLDPSRLLTFAARQLDPINLVKAQNDVRNHLVQLAGAIMVLGTLGFTFWNTKIARDNMQLAKKRFEEERKNQWAEKVRDAYAEWAGLFVEATITGAYLAEAKANRNPAESTLLSRFRELHEKAEIVTYKILMLEKRPLVIEAFKKLNSERFPNARFQTRAKRLISGRSQRATRIPSAVFTGS